MTYVYECDTCAHTFDVIKSVDLRNEPEHCERCNAPARREFFPKHLHYSGTKVTHAEWHPAFGRVIKNQRDLKYEVDKTGAIEVGNEKPERIKKHFDDLREERRNKSWDKVLDD